MNYDKFVDSMRFDLTREFLKSYAVSEREGYLFYADLKQKVRLCYYSGKNYRSQILSDSFKTQHTFQLDNFVFVQKRLRKALLFDKGEQKETISVTGLPSGFFRVFKEEPTTDSIPDVTSNSPVFFDEIVLNDTGHLYSVPNKYVFPRQTSSLRIDSSSPYYGHAENGKFSYMVSSEPKEWKEVPKNRSITLNNLPVAAIRLSLKRKGRLVRQFWRAFNLKFKKSFLKRFYLSCWCC